MNPKRLDWARRLQAPARVIPAQISHLFAL